jgi:hypothetical protein
MPVEHHRRTQSNEKVHILEIYPTIGTHLISEHILAFDKLDGSNIRAEWTRKNGFNKFGTRRRLLDPAEPILGEAVTLFQEKYADSLNHIFRKEGMMKATAFFEFHGENSFAGQHEDEEHTVTLFDIHNYKQGLLTGSEFMKLVGNRVETVPVLWEGTVNSGFIKKVIESSLEGMTFEGVVCKGKLDNRNRPNNFKIKSEAWLHQLKNKCGDDEELFKRLR